VRHGRLRAFRTPGGHLRIRASDLVAFMGELGMAIPQELETASSIPRLLVIDDDEKQLRALDRILRPYRDLMDYRFMANAVDALVMVGAFRPHVILLDVYMPGMDGIECCRRLKENPTTSGIDIIMLSGKMDDELRARAMAAGAKKALMKPYELGSILSELGVQVPLHRAFRGEAGERA
jgi:PleD family two-component response regulator